jgi:hypothetical protein
LPEAVSHERARECDEEDEREIGYERQGRLTVATGKWFKGFKRFKGFKGF